MSCKSLECWAILIATWLLALPLGCASAFAEARQPNVILINVDDLGWTDLGCFGSDYYETPHIDRLASGGMRFTDGYAACAVCSPSRAALMTGRYPARLGITDWIRARFQGGEMPADGKNPGGYTTVQGRPLAVARNPLWMELEEVTVAELLKSAGYATCHIGKWHLGMDPWYPQHQGFDFNFGGCDYGQPPSYFDPFTNEQLPQGIPHLAGRRDGEYLADREADEAEMFIRQHAGEPFFLYLANYAVHTPIQGRPDLVAKYQAKAAGRNHRRADYAAMVESVDQGVGQVLQVLDELSLTQNTLIIFTGDNGGLLPITSNAPLKLGKGYAEEGGIRVPLIVCWPGRVPAGSTTHTPAIGVDMLPTICEAAGIELPGDRAIDGVSLMPVLREPSSALAREALFWHFPHYRGEIAPYSVMRQGDWKLIRRYETGEHELYNLRDDLSESRNLAETAADRVQSMSEKLDAWLAQVGAIVPRPKEELTSRHPDTTK
jgi:arylsulfatase A-like enzyme